MVLLISYCRSTSLTNQIQKCFGLLFYGMIIKSSIIILSLCPIQIERINYCKIPYESLYEELTPNKNTMEFNYLKSDELIKQNNQKLIEEIFLR